MPVIHPRKPTAAPKKSHGLINILLLIAIVGIAFMLFAIEKREQPMQPQQETAAVTVSEPVATQVLKSFSGPEFVNLYNSYAYPNVIEFETAPTITGDQTADERIRALALERGYRGRSIAIPPLVNVDSYQLQERAAMAWSELKAAAKKDGHTLSLTAGFRTIEDQRDLFLESLYTSGATKTSIAAGKSDTAIVNSLRRVSIPGYTRHHSGYTVDIGCQSDQAVVFGASRCFQWLSKDNYANAKTYGWIPSYPEGAPNQGPDPEEWEYSWVGSDALRS